MWRKYIKNIKLIYIYDSSEGNETEDVVREYMENGYNNIYYIQLSTSISVDEKTVLILSGYGLRKQYDYI